MPASDASEAAFGADASTPATSKRPAREVKAVGRSVLDQLGMLQLARAVRRTAELVDDGVRAVWRRVVHRDFTSPRVGTLAPSHGSAAVAPMDAEELQQTLHALYERYTRVPEFAELVSPFWQSEPARLDLTNFRAHGGFLWARDSDLRHRATARYIRRIDRLHLLRLLDEDEDFGCLVVRRDGVALSRDKLDSILEIYYLLDTLGLGVRDPLKVLDIGAGYGRLAHRFTTVFPHSRYFCIDAVPFSTVISQKYLEYRNVDRATVVALDRLEELAEHKFDFAINVHSFPEQTTRSIEFWLGLLDRLDVRRLAIVDHNGQWLTMEQPDNRRSCYLPLLEGHGWKMLDARPKFPDLVANVLGINPEAVYATFART